MAIIVEFQIAPASAIQLNSMAGINALAAAGGGVIFTFSHMINNQLQSIDYYAPYAGQWFMFNTEGAPGASQ